MAELRGGVLRRIRSLGDKLVVDREHNLIAQRLSDRHGGNQHVTGYSLGDVLRKFPTVSIDETRATGALIHGKIFKSAITSSGGRRIADVAPRRQTHQKHTPLHHSAEVAHARGLGRAAYKGRQTGGQGAPELHYLRICATPRILHGIDSNKGPAH